jgi:transposase-like protein
MSKIPQGEWSAIAARYAKGESISRIAQTYGCTPPAIHYILKRSKQRSAESSEERANGKPDLAASLAAKQKKRLHLRLQKHQYRKIGTLRNAALKRTGSDGRRQARFPPLYRSLASGSPPAKLWLRRRASEPSRLLLNEQAADPRHSPLVWIAIFMAEPKPRLLPSAPASMRHWRRVRPMCGSGFGKLHRI